MLIALSAGIAAFLLWIHAPAALMLGPLIAGIVVASSGGKVAFPLPPFVLAQGVVGCLIASMVPLSIVDDVLRHWVLFGAGVVLVVVVSSLLGWLMTRWQMMPGTTALWGTSAGAASVMTIMAEHYGADPRLVAFMQYLRVVLVAVIAAIVARLFGVTPVHAPHDIVWFPAVAWLPLAETLALAIVGPLIARWMRIPAGAFLVPLVLGIVLTHFGLIRIELPTWLLAASYAFVGWNVGLRFTRPLLIHALKALPCHLRRHADPDRAVRRHRRRHGLACRRRSADRLPRHQPRRLRFHRHHRRLDQCRRVVRHGHADGAHDRRAVPRTGLDQVHRRTSKVSE